jgi:hypothetical protein
VTKGDAAVIAAQAAYAAYFAEAEGKSLVSGEPLPSWPELGLRVQFAWIAAARAACALGVDD